MGIKRTLSTLILGTLLAANISGCNSVEESGRKHKKHSLGRNIVKAEVVNSHQPDLSQVTLPEALAKDRGHIMIYYSDNNKSLKTFVSAKEYFKFKQMPHTAENDADYVNWVTYQNETIIDFAKLLTENENSLEGKAKAILDFVHSQIYKNEIEADDEYIRYPLETIVERNGDCEDLAILGAALMKSIGIDVALINYDAKKGEESGHVGLGIAGNFSGTSFTVNGKKYFYAETTGTNWLEKKPTWKIGDLPAEYKNQGTEIYIVN